MEKTFTSLCKTVARAAGRPLTFVICCCAIVLWAATDRYSAFPTHGNWW